MAFLPSILVNYENSLGPIWQGDFAPAAVPFNGRLKVVTYNINFGLEIEKAIEELRTFPSLENADIILLQEMDEEGTDRLAKVLKYNYVYYPASIHSHGRNFGNAILAKWPLLQPEKILLPHRSLISRQMRIAVKAKLRINQISVLVYCAHTEVYTSTRRHRNEQIQAVADHIDTNHPHVVVGGDFNTVSRRSINRLVGYMAQASLERASKGAGPTVSKMNLTPSAADHIFTRGFKVVDRGAVRDAQASDHFPVWVELEKQETL